MKKRELDLVKQKQVLLDKDKQHTQNLIKELDVQTIDKIIKNAINNLEKKENINIILSEKYAKLLFEFQKKSLKTFSFSIPPTV